LSKQKLIYLTGSHKLNTY